MTAALSFLFSPLHTAANFFHWDMFNEPADALWLHRTSQLKGTQL